MKKSTLLIAVLAVMSAVSSVSAKGPQINFDGRNIGAISFTEAVQAIENADISMVAVPEPIPVAVTDIKMEEAELNRSIGTAIKDCEKKELSRLKSKFEKLLTQGLLQEKRDFVYNNKQTYEFPTRLFMGTEEAKTGTISSLLSTTRNCVTWDIKKECVTNRKEVCHTTCAAAVLVCIAVAGAASPVCTWAAPICTIACSFVDDTVCTDVKYCTGYATWPGQQPQADPW